MNQKLPLTPADAQLIRSQHSVLKRKFMDVLSEYQRVENAYSERYRAKCARDYRVGKCVLSLYRIRLI